MTAKIILVTGATDGIGFGTAQGLARAGHHVLVHGRTAQKAETAVERLRADPPGGGFQPGAGFTAVHGDLSSKAEIRALADRVRRDHPRLDVLLNNAGVFMDRRELSVDGIELTFMVNHLAPMLLTHELLAILTAPGGSSAARVVNVSSIAHGRAPLDWDDLEGAHRFEGYRAYALSKLGNVFFTMALSRRFPATQLAAFALHPGVITTKLLKKGFGMAGASIASGTLTSIHAATSPELEGRTGLYFSDSRETPASSTARNEEWQERFFRLSAARLGIDWA